MSPLATILLIMLLTVVYNQSQFVTDYQDVYQQIIKKNPIAMDYCDPASQQQRCEKPFYRWKKIVKDNDYYYDDDIIQSRDWISDDITRGMDQKRSYIQERKHRLINDDSGERDCRTVTNPVYLKDKAYYPNLILNITCEHFSDNQHGKRICLQGSHCRPVEFTAKVLVRRLPSDTSAHNIAVPHELRACWNFEDIPIHVGCKCSRTHQ